MPVGYSGTPLVKKLGIKTDFKLLLVNIPDHYWDLLETLPDNIVEAKTHEKADFIHLFVTSQDFLASQIPQLKEKLATHGMLWISWPKGSSKIPKDLNENNIRKAGLDAGLVDVKICAVDQDWSGLKFMYRVKDRK